MAPEESEVFLGAAMCIHHLHRSQYEWYGCANRMVYVWSHNRADRSDSDGL